jgi:2-dehydropantoate 2-reductase
MNVLVVGVGGIGGYFGGKLAKSGVNVTFFARGEHKEAIINKGLQVKSINGDFIVFPEVIDNVRDIKKYPDLIILGVKSWQVKAVAELLIPFVGPNTLVLPLQNGADNTDQLISVLHQKNIIAGLCKIVSKIESPGIINHFAYDPEIVFGELNNKRSLRTKKINTLFNKASIKNKISDDIILDIWRKFLFITTYSGIGALTRSPLGSIRKNDYLKNVLFETASEIVQVANAKHISLSIEDINKTMHLLNKLENSTTASMQRDIMAGKPSELENFNGYIVKQGKILDVKTPRNEFIYNALLPIENQSRKLC